MCVLYWDLLRVVFVCCVGGVGGEIDVVNVAVCAGGVRGGAVGVGANTDDANAKVRAIAVLSAVAEGLSNMLGIAD